MESAVIASIFRSPSARAARTRGYPNCSSFQRDRVRLTVDEEGVPAADFTAHPGAELRIDVDASSMELPDGRVIEYPIDAFARYCLTQGIDQLGYLQQQADAIASFEETRSWTP